MNTYKSNGNDEGLSAAEIMVPALIGLGVALASVLVLVFLAGAVVYSTADPNKLTTPVSLAILAVSSFLSGFAGAKRGGNIVTGIISGVLLALVLFVCSFITGGSEAIPTPYSYLIRIGSVVVSAIGAFISSRAGRGKRFSASPKKPRIRKMK